MRKGAIVLFAVALAGCGGPPPGPPQLETGITSSNGGGTNVVGTNPNVGVTTRVR